MARAQAELELKKELAVPIELWPVALLTDEQHGMAWHGMAALVWQSTVAAEAALPEDDSHWE